MSAPTVYASDPCYECELQAAGRCPTCRHGLCMDHFPLDAHDPCLTRLADETSGHICYVCAAPVAPQQWSTAIFAHYIDGQRCAGCGRFVCAQHTRTRDEVVKIDREGLRSNRYHTTVRYCDLCAPVRRLGGLVGAAWWAMGLASAGAAAFFLFQR